MATESNAQLGTGGRTYSSAGSNAAYTSGVGSAEEPSRSLVRTVYENPLPVIAAGIGLALVLTARPRRSAMYPYDLDTLSNKLRGTARYAAKLARKEMKARRHQLAEVRDAATDLASDAISEARRRARKRYAEARTAASERATDAMHEARRRARTQFEEGRGAATEFASDTLQAARRRAREKLSDTSEALADLAYSAIDEARRRARQISSGGLTELVTNKPVALSALGILLGALTAAAIPLARRRGWFANGEDTDSPW
jgi:vacuolar-type H+-ATPase subunit H